MHVVSKSEITLPFSVRAASLPGSYQYGETDNDNVRASADGESKNDAQQVKVGLDTRLNPLDRHEDPCNQAILRINTACRPCSANTSTPMISWRSIRPS